jgi:molybdate transport system regulatory protein
MVLVGDADVRFSARNQYTGKVTSLVKGGVNAELGIELPSGTVIHAVITNEAVLELGLKQGVAATALIKASHVVLGMPA